MAAAPGSTSPRSRSSSRSQRDVSELASSQVSLPSPSSAATSGGIGATLVNVASGIERVASNIPVRAAI
ncbi:hypothetical protein F2P81_002773 [Scophthalmus maximus]|uniref:Uncharacterized protein n=1 Tax=Scophthalmus maximus TaxID=52904 RepID=A0A6A4TSM9_SCOMX|nr:hypothetical protein F2P81_002773 [Scophthalmus maximus]